VTAEVFGSKREEIGDNYVTFTFITEVEPSFMKEIKQNVEDYDLACRSVWVCNLVSHSEGAGEQAAEQNIRT
jgi:hypothetical protein